MGRRGFSIIEALVAVALVGSGVAAVIGGLGAMTNAHARAKDSELRQRLAFEKYDELLGTGEFALSPVDGDLRDRGYEDLIWNAELAPTGIESLEKLTVSVHRANRDGTDAQTVVGLVFRPPADGGAP